MTIIVGLIYFFVIQRELLARYAMRHPNRGMKNNIVYTIQALQLNDKLLNPSVYYCFLVRRRSVLIKKGRICMCYNCYRLLCGDIHIQNIRLKHACIGLCAHHDHNCVLLECNNTTKTIRTLKRAKLICAQIDLFSKTVEQISAAESTTNAFSVVAVEFFADDGQKLIHEWHSDFSTAMRLKIQPKIR